MAHKDWMPVIIIQKITEAETPTLNIFHEFQETEGLEFEIK